MGMIGISLCDFCGKRTENFAGKMIIYSYKKEGKKYNTYSPRTQRSWALCKPCLNKLSAVESVGDKIKEEIELKIDKIKLEQIERNCTILLN